MSDDNEKKQPEDGHEFYEKVKKFLEENREFNYSSTDDPSKYLKSIVDNNIKYPANNTYVYAAPFENFEEPQHPDKVTTYPTVNQINIPNFITEELLKDLLTKIQLWLNGYGDYPKELTEFIGDESFSEIHLMGEDEANLIPEKTIVQFILWLLK